MTCSLTPRQAELIELCRGPAKHILAFGGSRCVAGDTVLDGHTKTIAQLAAEGLPVQVVTSWGTQWAEAPFRKGADELLAVTLADGRSVTVTSDHRFWTGAAWVRAETLQIGDVLSVRTSTPSLSATISGFFRRVSLLGAGRLTRKVQDWPDRYSRYCRQCDARPRAVPAGALVYRASVSGGPEHSPSCRQAEARGSSIRMARQILHGARDILLGLWYDRPSRTDATQGIGLAAGFAGRAAAQTSARFRQTHQDDRRFQSLTFRPQSFAGQLGSSRDQCGPLSVSPCDVPRIGGYALSPVVRITRTAKQAYYTLHVPGVEHYFANGVLHHNSGKTFAFCYVIAKRALVAPGSRHVIFRRHGVAVRQSIGNDTLPKVFALAHPEVPLKWHDRDGYFALPNGSEIWLAGLDDKDRVDKVLGKEFATTYFNEASEIPLASYMVAQTRLAQKVSKHDGRPLHLKSYADLNPTTRNHWTYRIWIDGVNPDGDTPVDMEQHAHIVINPRDNIDNLTADYLLSLSQMPERVKRRFYFGEYSADMEDALWRREWIRRVQEVPQLVRIVVAIDPAVSTAIGSDETGIICAALGVDGNGYILADDSGKYRPEEWARRAISLARQYRADRIIAEVNQGGDMVESTLRAQASNIPFRKITATRGKILRAEPISALYERGKIFHTDEFGELEAQQCAFTTGFDRHAQGYSPDRVDALVYALTELFPQLTKTTARLKPIHRPKPRFMP